MSNVDRLGHAFACQKCKKLWKRKFTLNRHEATCTGTGQRQSYTGGVYVPPPSPLETLERHGLSVDATETFPFRATYDFETILEKENLPTTKKEDSKTVYTARHVPLSVSISSNVPGFDQPKFFKNCGNDSDDAETKVKHQQKLVDDFVDYLEEISSASFELMKVHYQHVYDELAEREKEENEAPDKRLGLSSESLKAVLDSYLRELPVLGFNSSNYDINVIKMFLFKRLCSGENEEEESESESEKEGEHELGEETSWVTKNGIKYLVKAHNQYKCIATPTLKFLDMRSYLAPDCSYAKYLTAFGVKEKKSFWPYEYIDCLSRLKETKLPPHSAFFSSLKNENISVEEYDECQDMWKRSPVTGRPMTNLWELLEYYNNNDVQPFLSAIEEQSKFYAQRGIDMFKDGIGVPGLTLRYLFKTLPSEDVYFSLFSDDQSDIHTLLRDNLVGGPSIVFERYHEKDVTKIRDPENGKFVKSLLGKDANALYLWALMQNMPTGTPVIRRKADKFAPKKRGKYGLLAREWLEWTSHVSGVRLRHKFNQGEQRVGKRQLPVDGWDSKNKIAYQFHGCAFHGCDKCRTGKKPFPHPFKTDVPREELMKKTEEITEYLRESVGVTVVEMWECEWLKTKKRDPRIKAYLKSKNLLSSYRSPFSSSSSSSSSCGSKKTKTSEPINDKDIVRAIKDDTLFGLVQCDVEVPSHLRPRFSEMPPVFKNTFVSKDDIGDFMKNYADKHQLLSQPRRSLIGSMFGKQLVFATPLLKWYLAQGLTVSNVTLVVEYDPSACFRDFGDRVSNARREGELDPSKSIIGEIFKLLGNSAYGKTLTNILTHCDVSFVDNNTAQKKMNSPLFKKLTPLTENWNEVETKKEVLQHKLPLQIGFFVYQYAKLRMLEFYFDCIDKFIDRSDYQLCEMDTDSLYMSLSTPTLEDAVRPALRRQFFTEFHHWFPSPACDAHRSNFIECKVAGQDWTPAPCCAARKRHDKRTPGLFKLEYKGDGIVALCSKTYVCFGECITERDTFKKLYPEEQGEICTKSKCSFGKGCQTKRSAKGLSKKLNYLVREKYLNVLRSGRSGTGVNKSFRTDGRCMFTYTQRRDALSYFYIKRKIGPDGSSTSPLDI